MNLHKSFASRLGAEALGTFVLVFGGCGSAIFAAKVLAESPVNLGIGFLGVALAFGLSVLVMAYAVGHISGGHFNPAVTIGAALAGRVEWKAVGPYILTQIIAASIAGLALFAIASGKNGFNAVDSGFASNGYGERSPDGYSMVAALLTEVILTAVFLYIILGSTDSRAPKGFGPIAIGLGLTMIHLVSIPITNTSVNPARSLGVAWFAGGEALGQVWLFIVAPIVGAAIAGLSYKMLFPNTKDVILER
ncbi:aquaporin Z [Arthrobacter sp. 1088]|uniref:aquaporin Z n=1 Tax=Arthrobacter sp. 1088 TaxID=2817768 RepID=UPI00286B06D6|nr:aquaporin Z [Arthrobacter sp. 1088]